MATMNLLTKYRPLRIGYCVSGSNMDDLIEIAKLSCILSGGIMNPIINVDDPNADKIISTFDVDLLYPINGGTETEQFIQAHKHLSSWNFGNQGMWASLPARRGKPPEKYLRTLDTFWAINDFAKEPVNLILQLNWDENDPLNALFAVEYGLFETDGTLYDLPKTISDAFYKMPLTLDSSKPRDPSILRNITPIKSSMIGVTAYGHWSSRNESGLYVGDVTFITLVDYWNLRASGHNLLFVPLDSTETIKACAQIFSRLVKEATQDDRFMGGFGLWRSSMVSHEQALDLLDQLGIEKGLTAINQPTSSATWNGLNEHPVDLAFSEKQIIASVDHTKYDNYQVSFQMPEMPTAKDDFYRSRQQHFSMHIRPLTEFEYEDNTLRLPNFPDLNEWYGFKVAITSDDFRVKKDGIVLVVDTGDAVKNLYPIRNSDIIKKLFERAKIEATDSRAGLVTKKIIEQMDGLEGTRLFKIPGVRKLLKDLGQNDLVIKSRATQVIRDQDSSSGTSSFTAHENLHIQSRTASTLKPDEVFKYMLKMKMFRAGLEVKCPSCNLKPWLPMEQLNESAKCDYCGGDLELITQLKDRDWNFRKSGLFAAENNQEGAIPVILALHLVSHLGHDEFVYSTALNLKTADGSLECETDFAILGRGRSLIGDDPIAIAIGEMKSDGGEIDDKDIANMCATKKLLDASGLKTFLIFGKTATFTEAEIGRFKKLSQAGIDPILFTDQELNQYDLLSYNHSEGVTVPEPYAHNFDDLARNSKELYLK
jgi:hypothetical protein